MRATAARAGRAAAPLLARLPSRRAKLAAFVLSPQVRADPWALYAELQRRAPVLRTRFSATLLSRHADVTAVLRDRTTSVDEARATAWADADRSSPMSVLTRRMLLFRDPPDHERLRRLVSRAFTPRRVAELRGSVEEVVERRLDRLDRAGGADLVDELAYPVPIEVVCRLLGIPDHDHERVRRLTAPVAVAFDLDLFRSADVEREGDEAARSLETYLRAVATTPSLRRPGGLLEELVDAAGDDRLTLDEAVAGAALLLLAGHETTSNLVSAGVLALLANPAEAERWRAGDPLVTATAADELLRFTSPVQFTQRVATAPMEVGGTAVEPGELLALLLGAANRDPDVFAHRSASTSPGTRTRTSASAPASTPASAPPSPASRPTSPSPPSSAAGPTCASTAAPAGARRSSSAASPPSPSAGRDPPYRRSRGSGVRIRTPEPRERVLQARFDDLGYMSDGSVRTFTR